MNKPLWEVNDGRVERAGVPYAYLFTPEPPSTGAYGWRGFGIERFGFNDLGQLVDDVKYFYRHRPQPTRFTFQRSA